MPTPTPNEIADAAAELVADGVAAAASDGQSVTAMDPMKQLDVADRLASRTLGQQANAAGGSRSPWGMTRIARAVPPGTN